MSCAAVPKRRLARSVIREKAQLARAAAYAVTDKDVESPLATESGDLIGSEDDGTTSHDTSLNSSTGLSAAMVHMKFC